VNTPLRNITFVFIYILLAVTFISCLKNDSEGIPDNVLEVLNQSGKKKPGLMKVILEFQKPEDSIKLEAAYFIIRNLEKNYSIEYSLVDSNDNLLDININDFQNYNTLLEKRQSIEKIKGSVPINISCPSNCL
jgi:hypothetical protein